MDSDLRKHVVYLLEDGGAHMSFMDAVAEFKADDINIKPQNVEYSFYDLVEHLRITQHDILDFCINSEYKELSWPDEYWLPKDKKATKVMWDKSVKAFQKDLEEMIKLVKDPKTDLFAKIPWGDGQTYLREALLVADHNAYHIGELGILRQVAGTWPKNHKLNTTGCNAGGLYPAGLLSLP